MVDIFCIKYVSMKLTLSWEFMKDNMDKLRAKAHR